MVGVYVLLGLGLDVVGVGFCPCWVVGVQTLSRVRVTILHSWVGVCRWGWDFRVYDILLLEKVTLEHMGVDLVNLYIFAVNGKQ